MLKLIISSTYSKYKLQLLNNIKKDIFNKKKKKKHMPRFARTSKVCNQKSEIWKHQ